MIYHHALATGFSHGFRVAAGIILLALIITIAAVPGAAPASPAAQTQRQPSRTDDSR